MSREEKSTTADPGIEWTVIADVADGRIPVDAALDAGLTEEHFASANAAVTWRYVIEARLRPHPTSAIAIAAALQADGEEKAATWLRKVSNDRLDHGRFAEGMGSESVLGSDAMERIDWLRHWRDIRAVKSIADSILTLTGSGMQGAEIAGMAIDDLAQIGQQAKTELIDLGTTYDEVLQEALTTPVVTRTGLSDLDRALGGGLRPGTMVTLAARPGVGKSALALTMARHVAHGGQQVLFASLEMSRRQLTQRLMAAEARIPLEQIVAGGMGERMAERARAARDRVAGLPLHMLDKSLAGISEIRRTAQHLARRGELGLVVIDYLGLLLPESAQNRSRNDEVAAISRAIKLMSLDLDVPVLALSQLNRAVESRKEKTPTLADLRDSGAVEQDSDVVIFLSRDEARSGTVDITIAKNRQGAQTSFKAAFLADSLSFGSLAGGAF
jgi:replicative DNA helicase